MQTTSTIASEDAKRVPGWRRILDSFMDAEQRIRTNVELGQVRGVQAFHQRISDLRRKGYMVTSPVKIGDGYYAYALIGVWAGSSSDLPYYDALPKLTGTEDGDATTNAKHWISTLSADLLKRSELIGQRPPLRQLPTSTANTLAQVRDDLLALARETGAEIGHEVELGPLPALSSAVLVHVVQQAKAKPAPRRRASGPRKASGPDMMRAVLEEVGQPMHSKEIAAHVLASEAGKPEDERAYKGKTPAATMAAQLATSNKEGGQFIRTEPGCFGLREWPAEKLEAEAVKS